MNLQASDEGVLRPEDPGYTASCLLVFEADGLDTEGGSYSANCFTAFCSVLIKGWKEKNEDNARDVSSPEASVYCFKAFDADQLDESFFGRREQLTEI